VQSNRNRSKTIQGNAKAPIVLAAIGGMILFFVFFMGDHGLIQYWKLLYERNQMREKIEQLQAEQKQLEEEIELLQKNNQYIEKIARERYNMGREGERVYIIKGQANH
jgi:cell division protein FtsB